MSSGSVDLGSGVGNRVISGDVEFTGTVTADGGFFTVNGNIETVNGFVETMGLSKPGGGLVLDTGNNLLKDFQGYHRVDWLQGQLVDENNDLSVDWDNRRLHDEIGNQQLSWSSSGISLQQGLLVKSGANKRIGTATLVGGTILVANTSVTANTLVFITVSTVGGTQGFLSYTKVNGASFTINSSNAGDTSTVSYLLIETF